MEQIFDVISNQLTRIILVHDVKKKIIIRVFEYRISIDLLISLKIVNRVACACVWERVFKCMHAIMYACLTHNRVFKLRVEGRSMN